MWYFTGRFEARFNMIWITIIDQYVSTTGKIDRVWDMARQKWGNQDISLGQSNSNHILLTIMTVIAIFCFWIALAIGHILVTFTTTILVLIAVYYWNTREKA
jgi:hypothetical protein